MGAADDELILHKDRRTGADAVLDVTGRDQPDMRLHLCFAPACLCWELVERETAPYQDPPDPLLEAISRLVTAEYPEWHGTATELAQQLQSGGFTPNWIVRRLNAKHDILLQKYGIRIPYTAEGVQRERLAHDFGTKSSVLYPSRRGTGGNG